MEDGREAAPKQSLRAEFRHDGSLTVVVGAVTDLGLVRRNNEDRYGLWLSDDPGERARRGLLLAVADGMGGMRGGEVASRIAIETLLRDYRAAAGTDVAENLRAAVVAANRMVHREGIEHPELAGMGTTCTAAVVRGRELVVAHVGDSRAYRVRERRVTQLTHDHSLVGQMVRNRQLTAEQARTDPRRNVVTRSVGIDAELEVDAERVAEPLRHGDVVVLCTDGLHGVMSDEELGAIAGENPPDAACEQLLTLARERGAPDNVTVILARAEMRDPPATAAGPATVVALFLCPASRAPLIAVPRVRALADAGLEGDRHARRGSRRQVLLMPAEILDQLGLNPGDVREQVTVRGLDLDALAAGTRLRVGDALLEVGGPCQPCERMNEIRAGLRETLVGRRGRFVSVIEAGGFGVGDRFEVEPGTGA